MQKSSEGSHELQRDLKKKKRKKKKDSEMKTHLTAMWAEVKHVYMYTV